MAATEGGKNPIATLSSFLNRRPRNCKAQHRSQTMEIFQDSLAASLAVGAVVGLALAAPTWAGLRLTNLKPNLQRLITGVDFAVFGGATAYILHAGLLA
jgi:hypothetical protein